MDRIEESSQNLTNQILVQMNQISTNMQKFKQIIKTLNNELLILEFSRISISSNIKCNFCQKISYYQDNNNKYYCWFHRSQYE
jgi:hypothetical protein